MRKPVIGKYGLLILPKNSGLGCAKVVIGAKI